MHLEQISTTTPEEAWQAILHSTADRQLQGTGSFGGSAASKRNFRSCNIQMLAALFRMCVDRLRIRFGVGCSCSGALYVCVCVSVCACMRVTVGVGACWRMFLT